MRSLWVKKKEQAVSFRVYIRLVRGTYESFGFGVWLDVGRTTFERLTCLPCTMLDFLAQQSRVTHHELFLFYGNGGSQRLRIRGLGC
jgi:hypothetical protein